MNVKFDKDAVVLDKIVIEAVSDRDKAYLARFMDAMRRGDAKDAALALIESMAEGEPSKRSYGRGLFKR